MNVRRRLAGIADVGRPDPLPWYSGDGVTWDRWLVTDLFGLSGFHTAAAVGDDRIVVFLEEIADEPVGARDPAATRHLFLGTLPED